MKIKNNLVFFILLLILIVSSLVSIIISPVKISVTEVYSVLGDKLFNLHLGGAIPPSIVDIIWQIRFPRVILGMVTGMGLSLCGLVMQAIVKNPLADPYILGISSGGTLGATIALFIGNLFFSAFSLSISVSFFAFIGSLVASLLVFKISSIGGRITSSKLILSGVIINFICIAFSNLIIYLSNNNSAIRLISEWTMGSLAGATLGNILLPSVLFILIFLFFKTQYRVLNIMLLGDTTALTLGYNLKTYKKVYLIIISLLTGVLVASCGLIGFVGLVIPHITRSLSSTNHKINLKITILLGGIFLIWADIFSRIILSNAELPIGILTSLIGAPFFLYVMIKKSYSFSEE
ncbi:iron ABC transporter permease [uncultured Clostridium sp.]|uniref:FecCD family ABC transporter permease n=1 Tax=uncultured Clostridium sp. TaxID=59620 RepID=UPI002615803B|nr:iron ABC transporter permease [uncultured Clostridium sp.]